MPNEQDDKLYCDIADRIRWHRSLIGLSQQSYADAIGVKRAVLGNWEAGSHRVSLNGALVINKKFGLSLDFIYLGVADALPMTLRNEWLSSH